MPRTQRSYRKNFLSDVILKINFPVILEISEGTPSAFQKKIQDNFPILEPLQEIELKIENKGMDVTQQKSNRTVWKFRNKESTEFVELDYQSLAIIIKKYTDYNTLKTKAENIFSTLFQLYPNIVVSRLGLRYINKVTLEGIGFFSWTDYLNPSLIKNIDFFNDKTKIRRLLTVSELAIDEDSVLGFQYGILNSTYPSPIVKKEFYLDYDCYTKIQFEKEDLMLKVDKYHQYIKDNFEASITDTLRKVLSHE